MKGGEDLDAFDAMAAAVMSEAEYAATLPERIDRVVAEVNERLADVLPDGARFEFETDDCREEAR